MHKECFRVVLRSVGKMKTKRRLGLAILYHGPTNKGMAYFLCREHFVARTFRCCVQGQVNTYLHCLVVKKSKEKIYEHEAEYSVYPTQSTIYGAQKF